MSFNNGEDMLHTISSSGKVSDIFLKASRVSTNSDREHFIYICIYKERQKERKIHIKKQINKKKKIKINIYITYSFIKYMT